MRRRGLNSWQMRVYAGTDAVNRRKRWLTRTVHGSEREAKRELRAFLSKVEHLKIQADSGGDLLDRWFAVAPVDRAASTVSETRSLIGHPTGESLRQTSPDSH
jgi:hypothetical protein